MDRLIIKGAREHNLKNIDLTLPRQSLIVISGMSGSGKSSLAFDTIYAEGQRRYVESLSAYARQFLGRMNKPDVDYIEGLSPAISIEQKTTHKNPRSTVGTVTEIYDYLRLLYARIGIPHCPSCGKEIHGQSTDQILDTILSFPENSRISVLAPVVRGKKGEHQRILSDAKKAGFVRARLDGTTFLLDDEIKLDKNRKHTIEIVVDRLKLVPDIRKRLAESVETAIETADGQLVVVRSNGKHEQDEFFSQKSACQDCGISLPELQPRLFSFNNPYGACPECTGLGVTLEFDPDLVIPDRKLSFNKGAIATISPKAKWHRSWFEALAKNLSFSLDTPFDDLSQEVRDTILYGGNEEIQVSYVNNKNTGRFEFVSKYRGVLNDLKRRYLETTSSGVKDWLEGFMTQQECETCNGRRLRKESLAVTVGDKNIHSVSSLSIGECGEFFENLSLSETHQSIARQIRKEIGSRLQFMINVGLDYLSLERRAATLSGGEAQRIRLATQIGSSLVGVLYILDEPTIGLHQRDNERLLKTLNHLRNIGNTLIVVEHDTQTLRSADYIVDLGPGAGIHGGTVVAEGTVDEIEKNDASLTGLYLSGKRVISKRFERREGTGNSIVLSGAAEHNLKNIEVRFPLGKLIAITGVSGSGKSTLLNDLLYPVISNAVGRTHLPAGEFTQIEGVEYIDKVISIDQSAIGRTPRSNPATYVGLYSSVRDLFSALPESRARGYKAGRYSFNVKGGRCENCHGAGVIKIEMHFLPDVYITCDVCKGKRFNQETLDIRYRGKNIHDVLEMTVEEAYVFFGRVPVLERKLGTLKSVGLDYIKLGQSALTLSGGEAQRVKLSLELSKRSTGSTFYILDEPTTGLHFEDVKKLMEVLHVLVDKGNTVSLIEHNLDVITQADHIIDLGPEGGDGGGCIVASGTPEEVAACAQSYTGQFLREAL
ncbi:MAG: excinuclease ABC subunit A [Spirochaetales bacterium]|nr:excinuclease ABC subunit A [Spirochaetales bacterium]